MRFCMIIGYFLDVCHHLGSFHPIAGFGHRNEFGTGSENIETEYPSKEYSSGQYDEHAISSGVFVVIESESPGGSRVRVRGLGYHRMSSGRELI